MQLFIGLLSFIGIDLITWLNFYQGQFIAEKLKYVIIINKEME